MLKTLFLIISPAILFAGDVELSLEHNNGYSSYVVKSSSQNLKSELIFPFKFYALDLKYTHNFNFFDIKINSSFLLNDKTTIGKDYDWQNNNLTVFSTSDNKTDKYSNYGLKVSKNIFDNLKLSASFNYKILDIYWSNTSEEDFVEGKNSNVKGLALKYQQEFYQYNLSLDYKNEIYKDILIKLKPSFLYAFIESKDTHILRDFYTIQNSHAFGYGLRFNTIYTIDHNSKIKLSLNYETLKDKDVDMNYYNVLGKKYLSFPSSKNYENSTMSIGYLFSF